MLTNWKMIIGISVILIAIVISIVALMNLPIMGRCIGTGSMEPALSTGDITWGYPPKGFSDLHVGDIVVFEKGNETISHRIVEIISPEQIYTRGDANFKIHDDGAIERWGEMITYDDIIYVVYGVIFKRR